VSSSGTLTFIDAPAGATQQFIVFVNSDTKVEANETFTVLLSNVVAANATVSAISATDTGTGTITNDDTAALTVADVIQAEDAGAIRGLYAWRESRRSLAFDAACREVRAFEDALRAEAVHSDAARDHRVIEKLHERRREEWLLREEREEQKFLDEVPILRVAREPRGEG